MFCNKRHRKTNRTIKDWGNDINNAFKISIQKTSNDIHMSNRKIRNDHHKFTEMRQRENRKIRNTNWDPANAQGVFTKTVPKLVNSIPNVAKSVAKSVAGVFGGGSRRNRPSGSAKRGSDGGGYEGGGGEGGYGGGEAGPGPVGGPGGGGGGNSGSALNSEIPSAFSHVYDVNGTESSSLIPVAINVAVVGFLIFSKK
jgi:hypothetical protein